MNRFAPLLQQASARIALPQPTKSQILLEMAGDLEDLYQHHLAAGLDDAESARRAEEAFAINDDNLRYLTMIHKTAFDRFGDALAGQAATLLEKILLFLLVGFVLLVAAGAALRNDLLTTPNVFMWPVLGLAAIAFVVTVVRLSDLVRRRDLEVRTFRRGVGSLLFLAAAILTTGFFGFFLEVCLHMYKLAHAPVLEDMRIPTSQWLEQIAVMMNVTLLASILTALVWFVLANVAGRIERRRAAELLEV